MKKSLALSVFTLFTHIAYSQILSNGVYTSYDLCEGRISSWGWNAGGQLGTGQYNDSYAASTVSGLPVMTAVSGGNYHVIALAQDSTVWTWGYNQSGVLGNTQAQSTAIPIQINGLHHITAIDGGGAFSLALKDDGTVWAWGDNTYGQLGNGSHDGSPHPLPVKVKGLSSIIAISAGENHALALKSDSTVWEWGLRNQYSPGPAGDISDTAVLVFMKVIEISAGAAHSMALMYDGTVWTWGDNVTGALGINGYWNPNGIIQATAITGVKHISAGNGHCLALKSSGSVWHWGTDYTTNNNVTVATKINGIPTMTAISAGYNNSLASDNNGNVWSWGMNDYGQLGYGNTASSITPTIVPSTCASRALGLTQLLPQQSLNLFPIPCKDKIQYSGLKSGGSRTLSVYDFSGRKVYSSTLEKPDGEIDMRTQPAGIYLCILRDGEQIVGSRKVILE